MLRICRVIERVASSDATVMLLGESGTGKEVLAQGLHQASKRSGKFVAINCAAIPEALLESELFGYEKGAFTGAAKTTVGKIETAHGGTLMLDEIGDLPHPLQAKLLRFLQERKIERIGGRQEIAVDVRVVCATHQDLPELIKQQRFREDLYYRLAEIVVNIPALRERQGDALLLAQSFLRRFALEAAIMADGSRVTAEDLGLASTVDPASEGSASEEPSLDLRHARECAERQVVTAALARAAGNMARTAEMLGVSRPTLYDLMNRLAIRQQVES
ncbi:MAG: sigma 54-interacting transcriptional regulator [Rubrivivax sp.]|nr:sigma 54-interacting transcriptional regulator [Rubrivivax sp.]